MTSDQPSLVDRALKMPAEEVGAFFREQRRRSRISLRNLADMAGISNPYLSQIENGLRRPSKEVVSRVSHAIAQAMRTGAEAIDNEASDRRDVLNAIWSDPSLTEGQRKELAESYQRMRILTAERRARRADEA